MDTITTIAIIGIGLASYIYVVKTVLTNFSKSKGVISTLFWGAMFLFTLSFLFGSSSSSNYNRTYSGGGCDNDYDNCSFDNDNNDFNYWDDDHNHIDDFSGDDWDDD